MTCKVPASGDGPQRSIPIPLPGLTLRSPIDSGLVGCPVPGVPLSQGAAELCKVFNLCRSGKWQQLCAPIHETGESLNFIDTFILIESKYIEATILENRSATAC